MTMRSKLALGLAAGALVIGSVSPAAARGYDGRWRHYRHNDGPSAGAVVGVLLGVGLIAAIASAGNRQRDAERQTSYDPRYGDRRYDPRYDDRRDDTPSYDNGRAYAGEDEAVDACAVAARDEASRGGGFAEIRDITGVQPYGGGYDVTGIVDQRASYRSGDRSTRSFRCTFDNGRVAGVTFSAGV